MAMLVSRILVRWWSEKRRKTYSLNSRPLLLRNANLLRARWHRPLAFGILAQQLQKLIRVLPNQLRQLRVARAHLLQDRL